MAASPRAALVAALRHLQRRVMLVRGGSARLDLYITKLSRPSSISSHNGAARTSRLSWRAPVTQAQGRR